MSILRKRKTYSLTETENEILEALMNREQILLARSRLFWKMMGEHYGFDPTTVEPLDGDKGLRFTAESTRWICNLKRR